MNLYLAEVDVRLDTRSTLVWVRSSLRKEMRDGGKQRSVSGIAEVSGGGLRERFGDAHRTALS